MLNANPETERPELDEAAVDRIARAGARGALALSAQTNIAAIAKLAAHFIRALPAALV